MTLVSDCTSPEWKNQSAPKHSKPSPPTTLNLTKNVKDDNQSGRNFSENHSETSLDQASGSQFTRGDHSRSRTPEKLSPLDYSDNSENVSSPLTPSNASNLDAQLRQDLRQKIYARRKSQGLEDLKVEFKSPEPSEV